MKYTCHYLLKNSALVGIERILTASSPLNNIVQVMGAQAASKLTARRQLLSEGELPAVQVINPSGLAAIVFVCEHAARLIPASLDNLGLDEQALGSHIAWDSGAFEVAISLCRAMDAPLVASRISRLVYDCNRPSDSAQAMPAQSEVYTVPGNADLTQAQRRARIDQVYKPFQKTLTQVISAKMRAGMRPAIVTIHSFTPVYGGVPRQVELGILHAQDSALADAMLKAAPKPGTLNVQRNQPYGPKDEVMHTLLEHGVANDLPNVMIEMRNDLLETNDGKNSMAVVIQKMLEHGLHASAPNTARDPQTCPE